MDFIRPSAAVAVAGTTAATAYLNAKYHIYKDVSTILALRSSERQYAQAEKKQLASLFYLFEEAAKANPNARAIWSRTGCYTYAELYTRVLRYANYFRAVLCIQPGTIVGLYSPNTPEFIFIWFGLWAIGCAPAMINFNLAGAALVHCIKLSGCKHIFVDNSMDVRARVEASGDDLREAGVNPVFLTGEFKANIAYEQLATRPPNSMRDHVKGTFPMALIYTSGTTGMPKAFPFETQRTYQTAKIWMQFAGNHANVSDPADRAIWYDCMPMYHGTGGVSATLTLMNGMTLALGERFSANKFWPEIRDSGATSFVYVGETARYLLAQPPSALDKKHSLRVMYGNGLRPDVWTKFQERFNVPEVAEFFTSTEGVFAVSVYSRSGFGAKSVGHQGAIMRSLMRNVYVPVALDSLTNDMYRDPKTGFARRTSYKEGGELIVAVPDPSAWPGYWRQSEASNEKFAHDVFKKGDCYYRPGDALKRDDDGLWYFMDRLGDTYRWKGENVSTAEVAGVMGTFPGIGEANVYGVEVPGAEGRAGCAAVLLEEGVSADAFNWRALAAFLRRELPRYAVPAFVRVIELEEGAGANRMGTHNNKQNKVLLRLEGADPATRGSRVLGGAGDRVFWLTPDADRYLEFGAPEWKGLQMGKAKL